MTSCSPFLSNHSIKSIGMGSGDFERIGPTYEVRDEMVQGYSKPMTDWIICGRQTPGADEA